MDRLTAMQTFVKVIETGSFSAAARRLRVGQPAVSKAVAQLEERLGLSLLLRSSRSFSATEAGQICYEHARLAIAQADEAELSARGVGDVIGRAEHFPDRLAGIDRPRRCIASTARRSGKGLVPSTGEQRAHPRFLQYDDRARSTLCAADARQLVDVLNRVNRIRPIFQPFRDRGERVGTPFAR